MTFYLSQALAQLPRLISRCDREPFSRTHGSFDRTYWGWKFTDFPGARFQEAAYALAHLYCHELPGNRLHRHAEALEWTRAAMTYWRSLQCSDGSFDEAYPYEHSLAATAFTSFYIGEAFLMVREELPSDDIKAMLRAFRCAGNWLCRNDETHGILSNHLAAAAAALAVIQRISDEGHFGTRCRYFLDRIREHQSQEGWYEEYGGADIGYQTHGTFYLARVWQLTGDEVLLDGLRRSVAFLKHFVHPDRTLGGEYGSRNTAFYFPAGFEILAPVCADAAAVARFLYSAVGAGSVAGLNAVDAYNFLPMLNNYLFAHEATMQMDTKVAEVPPLPCEASGAWHFPDAGLQVLSTPRHFTVIGLSKGGVVKTFLKEGGEARLLVSDCGWWGLGSGNAISSQVLTRPASAIAYDSTFEVRTGFAEVNQRLMTPWLFIAFRLFCLVLGRSQKAALWVKALLVRVLVSRKRPVSLYLSRRVTVDDSGLVITDTLHAEGKLHLDLLAPSQRFCAIHMGSARYFQDNDLNPVTTDIPPPMELAHRLMRDGETVVERRWPFLPATDPCATANGDAV